MFKHVVCFKLKDSSESKVREASEVLLSMRGKVKEIIDIKVGIDILHSDRSYDLVIEVTLQDQNALDMYQNDPYHCSVVKTYIHSVIKSSIAVDYIIDEQN